MQHCKGKSYFRNRLTVIPVALDQNWNVSRGFFLWLWLGY